MSEKGSRTGIILDEIVHQPARLLVMTILSIVNTADFTFLLKNTELTRGNLSSHLSKLEDAGYVTIQKKFINKMPRTFIKLSKKGSDALEQYRKDMKKLLGE